MFILAKEVAATRSSATSLLLIPPPPPLEVSSPVEIVEVATEGVFAAAPAGFWETLADDAEDGEEGLEPMLVAPL